MEDQRRHTTKPKTTERLFVGIKHHAHRHTRTTHDDPQYEASFELTMLLSVGFQNAPQHAEVSAQSRGITDQKQCGDAVTSEYEAAMPSKTASYNTNLPPRRINGSCEEYEDANQANEFWRCCLKERDDQGVCAQCVSKKTQLGTQSSHCQPWPDTRVVAQRTRRAHEVVFRMRQQAVSYLGSNTQVTRSYRISSL